MMMQMATEAFDSTLLDETLDQLDFFFVEKRDAVKAANYLRAKFDCFVGMENEEYIVTILGYKI